MRPSGVSLSTGQTRTTTSPLPARPSKSFLDANAGSETFFTINETRVSTIMDCSLSSSSVQENSTTSHLYFSPSSSAKPSSNAIISDWLWIMIKGRRAFSNLLTSSISYGPNSLLVKSNKAMSIWEITSFVFPIRCIPNSP